MLIDFCHCMICNIKICYIKIFVILSCLYSGFYMTFSKVINNMVYVTDTVISEKKATRGLFGMKITYLLINNQLFIQYYINNKLKHINARFSGLYTNLNNVHTCILHFFYLHL